MRIAYSVKVLFVFREDKVVGRYEILYWRFYFPAFFNSMVGKVNPVQIVEMLPANYLVARLIAISTENIHLIVFICGAITGKETRIYFIACKFNLFPFIHQLIVSEKIFKIRIRTIAAEQVKSILAFIIKNVVVMSLLCNSTITNNVPF